MPRQGHASPYPPLQTSSERRSRVGGPHAAEDRRWCAGCVELPPGLDGLYELAYRSAVQIEGMVDRGEISWASLSGAAEREEMEEVVVMMTEAAAQGRMMAQVVLGDMYYFGKGMVQDYGRAFELFRQAARQASRAVLSASSTSRTCTRAA